MARVDFTFEEWRTFVRSSVGEGPVEEDRTAYDLLLETRQNHRAVNETMEHANEFLDGSGVEAIFEGYNGALTAQPDPDGRVLADYVNFGDTYVETLLYDHLEHAFLLGSWGSFVETWEAANPVAAVCSGCGTEFNPDEAGAELGYENEGRPDGDLCASCVRDRDTLSVWYPDRWSDNPPPLIAMLRSVEGDELAVHFWDDRPVGVAFSVPLGNGAFSAQQIKGRRSDEPYVEVYEELVDYFRTHASKNVAHTTRAVTLEREMLQHLKVAMDAFFVDMRPMKEFLKVPPVLWTCRQVDHVQWLESERGNMGPSAAVEAYVGDYMEADALSVWSASGRELQELIDDGFIKFGDDRSVRDYLQHIGVCRAK